jgi:hypothetical protein
MNELVALKDLCTTLHKEVADLEKERRELQGADADSGATFVWLCNALGDRVAMPSWPMRLRLLLEGLAQQPGVPRPWIDR